MPKTVAPKFIKASLCLFIPLLWITPAQADTYVDFQTQWQARYNSYWKKKIDLDLGYSQATSAVMEANAALKAKTGDQSDANLKFEYAQNFAEKKGDIDGRCLILSQFIRLILSKTSVPLIQIWYQEKWSEIEDQENHADYLGKDVDNKIKINPKIEASIIQPVIFSYEYEYSKADGSRKELNLIGENMNSFIQALSTQRNQEESKFIEKQIEKDRRSRAWAAFGQSLQSMSRARESKQTNCTKTISGFICTEQ